MRLFQAILSLEEMPARCAVISEAKELGFPAGHLLYGKEKGTYRIIFDIREVEQHVGVLRIWHASRSAITAADIAEDRSF